MTATISEQPLEPAPPSTRRDRRRTAAGRDDDTAANAPRDRSAPAAAPRAAEQPPPGLGALEPLIRLDARVRRDPEATGTPMRRTNTFRLHREEELRQLLSRRGADGVSATAPASGDRRRPTELATEREERRQVIAVSRLICQATMESLAGLRPVQQLQRWLDPLVYDKVRERSELLQHTRHLSRSGRRTSSDLAAPPRLSLRRIRTHPVETGIWEVSVIFAEETRTRACAMRVEAHRGRWRAVALELG